MAKLVIWGVFSSVLFTATWILNRMMSLEGGHWVWTASLRYFHTVIILLAILFFTRGLSMVSVFREFRKNWK